ncbi:DUF883 family protein [Massilia sp. METH4]|uniref:DUF883 family protein n=1 Tax=Massilia sp. METH4 TaxID=3123041 RepID=UPI0030D5EB82
MDHLDPTRYPEPPQPKPQQAQQASLQADALPAAALPAAALPADTLPTQQQLIGDLRQVIDNAEDLLTCTDSARNGAYRAAREKLAQALAIANEELTRFEDAQIDRMIAATHEASVRHNDTTGEARLLRAFH